MRQLLVVRSSPLGEIGANLALEWDRLQHLESLGPNQPPELSFYINAPCIVLGRSRKAEVDLTPEALTQAPGFLSRRRSGGGTVYHDENNLNFSLILPRELPGLPAGPKEAAWHILSAVIHALGGEAAHAQIERISDVTVRGLKVSGNAQYRGKHYLLHHGTLLLKADIPAIVRWLALPPERPDIPHQFFVTDLETLEFPISVSHWITALSESFAQHFEARISWQTYLPEETQSALKKAAEWTDPAWVRRL